MIRRRGVSEPETNGEDACADRAADLPPTTGGETLKPRPTNPTTLTRDELYKQVWSTPMERLAERYGISGNGLAKICRRANIPYPGLGYWAKRAVGTEPGRDRLPRMKADAAIVIRPTPHPLDPPAPPPLELSPELLQQVENVRAYVASMAVNKRLVKPHKIVTSFLDEHAQERQRAKEAQMRNWMLSVPSPLSQLTRRRLRLLDTICKSIEACGGAIVKGGITSVIALLYGEKVEFLLHEWEDTQLHFSFTMKYLPGGKPRRWSDGDKGPLEDRLPEILVAIAEIAAELAHERDKRISAEMEWRRRKEEEEERSRQVQSEANRRQHFIRLAQSRSGVREARTFLAEIQASPVPVDRIICGRSVGEWISWVEGWLEEMDPLSRGAESVFRQVGAIGVSSYPKERESPVSNPTPFHSRPTRPGWLKR